MAVMATVSGAAFLSQSMPALPRVPTPIQPMLILLFAPRAEITAGPASTAAVAVVFKKSRRSISHFMISDGMCWLGGWGRTWDHEGSWEAPALLARIIRARRSPRAPHRFWTRGSGSGDPPQAWRPAPQGVGGTPRINDSQATFWREICGVSRRRPFCRVRRPSDRRTSSSCSMVK